MRYSLRRSQRRAWARSRATRSWAQRRAYKPWCASFSRGARRRLIRSALSHYASSPQRNSHAYSTISSRRCGLSWGRGARAWSCRTRGSHRCQHCSSRRRQVQAGRWRASWRSWPRECTRRFYRERSERARRGRAHHRRSHGASLPLRNYRRRRRFSSARFS